MPDRLPFDWDVVSKYLNEDQEEMADRCASLRRQILSVLDQLIIDDGKKKQVLAWLDDVQVPNRLQIGLNRMMAQLEEQQDEYERAAEAEEQAQRKLATDDGPDHEGVPVVAADLGGADPSAAEQPSARGGQTRSRGAGRASASAGSSEA